jgi:hypothetical protein
MGSKRGWLVLRGLTKSRLATHIWSALQSVQSGQERGRVGYEVALVTDMLTEYRR